MMRKYLGLLALVTALLMVFGAAAADEAEKHICGDFEYVVLEDGTAEITRYTGEAETLTVPETLDGVSVSSIGEYAFLFRSIMTSITLPDSVKQMGSNPFLECVQLKSVILTPDHPYYATIDGVLFDKQSKKLIWYPRTKDNTAYAVPDGILEIGDHAFSSCTNLKSITLPDSVTSIGAYAFDYCESLTSITLPDSVQQMGANPFSGCEKLKSISLSPDHPYYATIDGVLFEKQSKKLIWYPMTKNDTAYAVPNDIREIGNLAFDSCTSLTSITLPDSLTSIGSHAFWRCENLTSITLPDGLTSIGNEVF